ncbi:DUF6541 family protein [Amycolatopsis regifaucium]|uniref:Copper-transporting ATPase n=1 Tax=Amycolatopsis regifaucium TaxID=546365 RepID=A0A154MGE7_9PSEU|nr:DUF6541 family protein [Amycolatopsis regifaucium]KZB83230.1 hypothetical protein AVL48_03430 [Amycolatopsis regifaucium]OKA09117.1 hypothetical protein ATP06_0209510 [Amycolatopsis regifaucium]SFI99365.1 hypothetical protein SAMN04489731_114242 [Amycolatopsis regifaucium]
MNVLLVVLAFWLPGLVFGAAIRLRGWTLAAAAPLLTFGLVAIAIPILGRFGIRWSMLNVGLWVLALSVVGFGLSFLVLRFTAKRHPDWAEDDEAPKSSSRDHLLIGAGVLVGVGVGAVTFLRGSHSLDNVQQDWDAPFHGNLVRWIAEHGDARPSTVGAIANLPNQTDYFYPDTYHALLALVFGKGGLTMMPTLNLAALMVVLTIPLGVAAMCRAWRMPVLGVAAAAAVSTWFTAFPYDSLWRGPLWPYVAGVALVPAMLALAHLLLKPRGIAGPVAIGVGVAGLAGLHTSLIFVIMVYFLLILLAVLFRLEKIGWRRSAASLVATIVAAVVLGVPQVLPALYNAGGVTSAYWASEATVSGAFGQTITFSPMASFPQWWIGVPAIIGVFFLVRHRRMLWMVGAYVVLGGLFAATISMETPLIHTLTGVFYNDHWRIGALVPLAGAVAFGEFVHTASGKFAEKLGERKPDLNPFTAAIVGAVLIGLVVTALSKGGYIGRNSSTLAMKYGDGPAVSKAEEAAYTWLGQHVVPGERVMNDKADGSVWMYALSGVQPVEWTNYGAEFTTKAGWLSVFLNDINREPRVRQALDELKVRYVIVGKGKVAPASKPAVGLQRLDITPGFKRVFHNSDASIYEIEGQQGVVAAGAATGSDTAHGQ